MRRFKGWTYSEKHDIFYRVKRSKDKKEVLWVDIHDPNLDIDWRITPRSLKSKKNKDVMRSSWSIPWFHIHMREYNPGQHAIAVATAVMFPAEREQEKLTAEKQLQLL